VTNQQLYFALGVPVLIYLIGFTTTVMFSLWQVKDLREEVRLGFAGVREDVRGLRTQNDLIMSKISDIDTRVAVLEDRAH